MYIVYIYICVHLCRFITYSCPKKHKVQLISKPIIAIWIYDKIVLFHKDVHTVCSMGTRKLTRWRIVSVPMKALALLELLLLRPHVVNHDLWSFCQTHGGGQRSSVVLSPHIYIYIDIEIYRYIYIYVCWSWVFCRFTKKMQPSIAVSQKQNKNLRDFKVPNFHTVLTCLH